MQGGQQIEEGISRIRRDEIAQIDELLPRQELPDQKEECGYSRSEQAQSDASDLPPPPAQRRPLQADTAHDQRSEEHTSELQSLMRNSYAVFCLKKKKKIRKSHRQLT